MLRVKNGVSTSKNPLATALPVSPEVAAEGFDSLEEDSTGGGFLNSGVEETDDLLG